MANITKKLEELEYYQQHTLNMLQSKVNGLQEDLDALKQLLASGQAVCNYAYTNWTEGAPAQRMTEIASLLSEWRVWTMAASIVKKEED